jgi:hypothetical protein
VAIENAERKGQMLLIIIAAVSSEDERAALSEETRTLTYAEWKEHRTCEIGHGHGLGLGLGLGHES